MPLNCSWFWPGWKKSLRSFFVVALFFPAGSLPGYESYHDPEQDDDGYCARCHPGFGGGRSDALHALHTGGSDPVTTNCGLCHTGSGRGNPLIMWSTGDNDDGLGCTGCHGRDYGETIASDYRGFTITGLQKNSGRGLRRHHRVSGITVCLDCHDDTITPYPENVINPGLGNTVHYYFRDDVNLGGAAVDPCANEDSGNDTDSKGLDNDGDDLYDANDPDCVQDPDTQFLVELPNGGIQVLWPTPSPGWSLQENPGLDANGWVDAGALARTQRVNGFWVFEVDPPLDPERFYRLAKPAPAPAAGAPDRPTHNQEDDPRPARSGRK